MSATTTKIATQLLWQSPNISSVFRSGVSLHSHTQYSEESLSMVPHYSAKVPYLGELIRKQEITYRQHHGKPFSFDDAFWTPPLTPRQAYRVEEKQIQRKFKLPALISLTDHDDIRAGAQLRILDRFRNIPLSTEWTIPFGETFFHLGVHHMPAQDSADLMSQFARFTRRPDEGQLAGILGTLDAYPDVLLVLNHPLWDEKGIGAERHGAVLRRLLSEYGRYFHALELNGLRGWNENKDVASLGAAWNLPVVAGGDRHGREPNAILNLSRATTFTDFVAEVRRERFSHVVFMPQYREPMNLRVLQAILDVVRDYPENFCGRRSWADRVYYRDRETKETVPMASLWTDGGPGVVRAFIAASRLMEWRPLQSLLRVMWQDRSLSLLSSRVHGRGSS